MELIHVVHAGCDGVHEATELDGDAEKFLDHAQQLRAGQHAVVQARRQEVIMDLKNLEKTRNKFLRVFSCLLYTSDAADE